MRMTNDSCVFVYIYKHVQNVVVGMFSLKIDNEWNKRLNSLWSVNTTRMGQVYVQPGSASI